MGWIDWVVGTLSRKEVRTRALCMSCLSVMSVCHVCTYLVDVGEAGQGVGPVDVHGARAADALAAGPSRGGGGWGGGSIHSLFPLVAQGPKARPLGHSMEGKNTQRIEEWGGVEWDVKRTSER